MNLVQQLDAFGSYARTSLNTVVLNSTKTAENIARRFGLLASKGRLAPGADADLVLVDMQSRSQLQADDLFYRHKHSPYVGMMLRGKIVRTLVRGKTVFLEGKIVSAPLGQLLTPSFSENHYTPRTTKLYTDATL